MEVSEVSSLSLAPAESGSTCVDAAPIQVLTEEDEPGGDDLIQAVVNLSGLPESLARLELSEILANSGQSSKDLTLDQLRHALAAYLETMQADFPLTSPNL
jgi:hypothetical protein